MAEARDDQREARPEHSYEAIRADIISALASDGFAYIEAEFLVRRFEEHVARKHPEPEWEYTGRQYDGSPDTDRVRNYGSASDAAPWRRAKAGEWERNPDYNPDWRGE